MRARAWFVPSSCMVFELEEEVSELVRRSPTVEPPSSSSAPKTRLDTDWELLREMISSMRARRKDLVVAVLLDLLKLESLNVRAKVVSGYEH